MAILYVTFKEILSKRGSNKGVSSNPRAPTEDGRVKLYNVDYVSLWLNMHILFTNNQHKPALTGCYYAKTLKLC